MQLFIKKIVLFFSIPFSIGFVFYVILSFILSSLLKGYKLDSNIREIFIGDSHITAAIDDNLIKNSKNLSQNAEAFLYSYFKLKVILESNPEIERVYLGYSYHNISSYQKGLYSNFIYSRYFFILPLTERIKLVKGNIREFPLYLIIIIKSGVKNLLTKGDYTFLTDYVEAYENRSASKESMDKIINYYFYTNGKLKDLSTINLFYFHKIIHLCKTYDVELIIINTPLHSYFRSKIPNYYINNYNDFIDINQLKVIDLSTLPLNDECFWPDGDHLSKKGRLLISKEFNKQKAQIHSK